jgi:glycosyltransferase involved in cell wall biosynthesis
MSGTAVKCVLFVISSLDYSGAARQLTLLASGLAREGVPVRVCVLGGPSVWGDELGAAGVAVSTLGRSRAFDVLPFLALRRLLRSFSGVVHAWGTAAFRAAALNLGPRALCVSAALPPVGRAGRIDAWLLRRVGRVVAFGETEAGRYRAAGVAMERITVITPAAKLEAVAIDGTPVANGPRTVAMLGPLLPHKGVRDAVWAMDMLHYLYPDLELLLVGHRPAHRELAGLSHVEPVQFAGPQTNIAPYLKRAELVWIPGRAGGVSAALDAMAAGRAVIAGRSPELAEVIEEDVTGSFFEPGDKADLARQTRRLLDDDARRRAMGESGQRRVSEHFNQAGLCAQYRALLDDN